MQKYKVIALSVGAKSNKIFKAGDIVTEDAFIEGRAQELVDQKFLAPLEEDQPEDTESEGDGDDMEQDAGEQEGDGSEGIGTEGEANSNAGNTPDTKKAKAGRK